MDEAKKVFESILHRNNAHITHARKQVFAALYGKGPQTMNELAAALQGGVDRVSVYRAIELFGKLGIIHKIQMGWKYKIELSDVFVDHHHHISCLGCGKVFAIHEDARIERLIAEIATAHRITCPSHTLEIQGYCEHCAKR